MSGGGERVGGQRTVESANRLSLYLPREWAGDEARRKRAEVPVSIGFATKSAIVLEQQRAARAARIPVDVVLADADYGNDTDFRLGIAALGLNYAVGIQGSTTVWAAGHQPLPPSIAVRRSWGRCRRRTRPHTPLPSTRSSDSRNRAEPA